MDSDEFARILLFLRLSTIPVTQPNWGWMPVLTACHSLQNHVQITLLFNCVDRKVDRSDQ